MNFEFIKNPDTGILEAWEDGQVVGEFVTTGMLAKCWKLFRFYYVIPIPQ